MKTIFALLLMGFILFNAITVFSQVFEKKKSYLDLGLGIGGYGITTQKGESSGNNNAAAIVFPLNYEYGLLNQVGIGLQYRGNRYISNDSLNKSSSKSKAFLLSNNLHLINNSVLDIYLGISYGIAFYNYQGAQNQEVVILKGGGFSYLTYGGIKTYIKKKLGLNIGVSYNDYSFEIYRFKVNNVNQIKQSPDNYNKNFSGIDLTVGFSYKISK